MSRPLSAASLCGGASSTARAIGASSRQTTATGSERGSNLMAGTCRTVARRASRLLALAAAVVAERVVALADRLPEADVARPRDEVEALLGVARDAVEERAQGAARSEAHVLGGLVAEQLQHHELRGRH